MELVTPDEVRTRFSTSLSDLYRAEVPLYGELLRLVADINARSGDPEAGSERIALERHGAIRLGRPDELSLMARLFAVMGMAPVGYYDLAPSGVPVHSTAFRPLSAASLASNPFRMFTSLLRLELIEDLSLRSEAERILAVRRIMTPRAIALIERAEAAGGLDDAQADELVREALETFRWNAEAAVDRATYERLRKAHPLIADVVCFKGPHVNHLTPRTFDIDAVHAAMRAEGMGPKEVIEGPPRRAIPILLRQTSFRAREEQINFTGESGTHTARFGEVEQRGAALTPKGRALYDDALATGTADAFARWPDDMAGLYRAGLIFCRFRAVRPASVPDMETAVASGAVVLEPITYEDFLPVSAAGIFRSNLAASHATAVSRRPGQVEEFEASLGCRTEDEMSLYAETQARSCREALATLRASING